MKPGVNFKLLVLFILVCGVFFYAESGFCANVYSRDSNVSGVSVANKSSTFSTKLNQDNSSNDSSDSILAEKIRAQRAAADRRDTQENINNQTKSGATKNNCDTNLRKCIESKCNSDYSKCATDSDTSFSTKLNECKKDANCSAHEFTLFVNEIKEDKKQAVTLSSYNRVVDCGNRYNNCIISECGPKFDKCLSKTKGDKAISACANIAKECTEADSGMVGRIGNIFGTVRKNAEKQISLDEKRLYELRDKMKQSCQSSGALFDERSLDCVYTVNFFAGKDKTLMASKKLYAGSSFDCTPSWFGIDVTTYMDNAYRETRAQSAASSAMMGSGLATGAGTFLDGLTSGAIKFGGNKDKDTDQNTNSGDQTTNQSQQSPQSSSDSNAGGENAQNTNSSGGSTGEETPPVIKGKIPALQDGNSKNPPKIEKPEKTDKDSLDKALSEFEEETPPVIKGKIPALQDGNSENPPKIEKPKKTTKDSLDKALSEFEEETPPVTKEKTPVLQKIRQKIKKRAGGENAQNTNSSGGSTGEETPPVIKGKIPALQDGNSKNPPKIEKPEKTDKDSLDKAWSEIEKADIEKTAREIEKLKQQDENIKYKIYF